MGIQDIIAKEKCGVVSEPEAGEMAKAIGKLKENYSFYGNNCLPTIKEYFSVEKFIESYRAVYSELAGKGAFKQWRIKVLPVLICCF